MSDFPVYEKNGETQIAATPAREIELRFDGWRKQEPKSADSGGSSDQSKQSKSSK